MSSILIVEDDLKIARFLQLELEHENYSVAVANDGLDGLVKARNNKPDLVLLDLMLPGISGIELCRRLRLESDMPVIMLTAKDDITDKVVGLDTGANDYITKPFAIEEVLARIRAALRRKGKRKPDDTQALLCGELTVNRNTHETRYSDTVVRLTNKEYQLLVFLMENKDMVLERDEILTKVWGYDFMGETNIVDVYISYLRSKIDQKFGVSIIKTVRGAGYIIREETGNED